MLCVNSDISISNLATFSTSHTVFGFCIPKRFGTRWHKLDFGGLTDIFKTCKWVNHFQAISSTYLLYVQMSHDANRVHSRQCDESLQVWAMTRQDGHHKTQHVIAERFKSHRRRCAAWSGIGNPLFEAVCERETRLRDNYLVCPQEVWRCGRKAE